MQLHVVLIIMDNQNSENPSSSSTSFPFVALSTLCLVLHELLSTHGLTQLHVSKDQWREEKDRETKNEVELEVIFIFPIISFST